jgi:hypothetical protein
MASRPIRRRVRDLRDCCRTAASTDEHRSGRRTDMPRSVFLFRSYP